MLKLGKKLEITWINNVNTPIEKKETEAVI